MKIIQFGTELLWDRLSNAMNSPIWYPIAVCTIGGVVIGLFRKCFGDYPQTMRTVIGEVLAGLVLGLIVAWLPVVQFSGESQMAVLIADYAKYAPIAMIGIAFLKVLMTNMCIQMGLKGGHFFPLIFSAVCLGYGISLMVFPMTQPTQPLQLQSPQPLL